MALITLTQTKALGISLECYNLLAELPTRVQSFQVANKNGYLVPSKRGEERGFYIVGKEKMRWVSIKSDYVDLRPIKITGVEGLDNLYVYAGYRPREPHYMLNENKANKEYFENQEKLQKVFKYQAKELKENDSEATDAVETDLTRRLSGLNEELKRVHESLSKPESKVRRQAKDEQVLVLEASLNGAIPRIPEICKKVDSEYMTEVMKSLAALEAKLKPQYEVLKTQRKQTSVKAADSGGKR